jgi:hypothetical protein
LAVANSLTVPRTPHELPVDEFVHAVEAKFAPRVDRHAFIPSVDGISRNEQEYATDADIAASINMLTEVVA